MVFYLVYINELNQNKSQKRILLLINKSDNDLIAVLFEFQSIVFILGNMIEKNS